MKPIPALIPFTESNINTIIPRISQCNHLLFFSCFLRAKKLPEPTKNKPEKNNPHQLDQIPLIVFSTPPKYFSTRTGCILFKKLIIPVRPINTIPPTQNKSDTRSQINWYPLH